MVDEKTVDTYLDRIGATRPEYADIDALRYLQERHIRSVPFENLGYHLDEPIHMDERVLDKIVNQRRGGGCYETNPAFALLLRALGFTVHVLPGRVYRAGRIGPPMCHLTLRVDLDEPWLVDTGFGRNSLHPLRFGSREPQRDPNGEYRFIDAEGGVDLHLNGKPLYRLDERPVEVADFWPTLWWYRTAPDSPFLEDLFCSLPTDDGRVTLKGDQLTVVAAGGRTTEVLADEAAIRAAYREHFAITLDRLPVRPSSENLGIQLN